MYSIILTRVTSQIELPGQQNIELATEWSVKRSECLLIGHPDEWQYIMLVMFKLVRKMTKIQTHSTITS